MPKPITTEQSGHKKKVQQAPSCYIVVYTIYFYFHDTQFVTDGQIVLTGSEHTHTHTRTQPAQFEGEQCVLLAFITTRHATCAAIIEASSVS